jgi:hypothetical protein
MKRFVLVTNTRWDEAPRIRHQVAHLLLNAGHQVLFLERSNQIFRPEESVLDPNPVRGLTIARIRQLMHPQLRVLPHLHKLDAAFVVPQLRELVGYWAGSDPFQVVNFRHDGWYLRRVFPGRRITTIINDDFEAQSRLPTSRHIRWALERTCKASDSVLAVSEPLCERLSEWCAPRLFLPWAVVPYRAPRLSVEGRKSLLYWGFVDVGLDLDQIERVSGCLSRRGSDWRILLVGPTQTRNARAPIVRRLRSLANVAVMPPSSLDELPIDESLAALMPYRRNGTTDAVTLANKSMQLLARGLPLLISAMPRFLNAPFVFRFDGREGVDAAVDAVAANFVRLQPEMEMYCRSNSPSSRLQLLTG